MNINLSIYYDDITRIETSLMMTKRRMSKTLPDVSIDHRVMPEFYLKDEDFKNTPNGSIIVIHGNARKDYENISRVRPLIPQRPDLKYVISYDDSFGNFKDRQDEELVRTALEAGFDAKNQVVIIPYNIACFFDGNELGSPIEESLENYCKQLKKLRGE